MIQTKQSTFGSQKIKNILITGDLSLIQYLIILKGVGTGEYPKNSNQGY